MTGWNDKYNRNLPFYFVIFVGLIILESPLFKSFELQGA